jgi:hypothetical protein
MFETETNWIDERPGVFFAGFFSGLAVAALPMLAFLSRSEHSVFPPAPYFLLALGVGLFIGLALLAISAMQT